MDRADSLLEEHRAFGVSRSGALLFYWTTARDVVDLCETRGIELLGLEGCYLTSDETYPATDWILDLSTQPTDYEAARQFLARSAGQPLFFEFVLNDPDA